MMSAFRLLAKFRFLRGTWLDPFGWTAERKMERRLIEDYCTTLETIAAGLNADNHAMAVQLASLPESIRGYGHVKAQNIVEAKDLEKSLLAQFAAKQPLVEAA